MLSTARHDKNAMIPMGNFSAKRRSPTLRIEIGKNRSGISQLALNEAPMKKDMSAMYNKYFRR